MSFISPSCVSSPCFFQVGNHIDVVTAKWVAQDAGIGAGVDSYFEYLVKGAILLQDEELMSMFLGEQGRLCVKGPRDASWTAPVKTLPVGLWKGKMKNLVGYLPGCS